MLTKTPRLLAALDLAAEKAGWGSPLPPRHGRGVSCQVSFASFIATVAHVEVAPEGEVKLHRLTTAVDTGIAVNPDTIVAQLQGGMIFGATAALWGEITIDKGRVQQSNFHDYRMLRINEAPAIDVHLIKSGEPPGGIGETGVDHRAAGDPQRDLCRDRHRAAAPADRPRRSGGEETRHELVQPPQRDMRYCCSAPSRSSSIARRRLLALAGHRSRGRWSSPAAARSALADYHGANPTGVPAELAQASLIKRGEYLTRAADCTACHTAKGGAPFAGGLAFKLPFGTIYSPNITADKDTGIGNWSDAQFLNALHRGIDDEGERLYPAMPYASYTYMTDADALAIKAYLFSLAPVHQENPEDTLSFPFNQRWLMGHLEHVLQCRQAFRAEHRRAARNGIAAPISPRRSRIAANATRRAISPSRSTTGRNSAARSRPAGAPTTSPATDRPASARGAATSCERYLATGHADGRGTASGPMGEAVDASFRHLVPGDIHAIVAYLRTMPAVSSDLPAKLAGPASASHREPDVSDTRGKMLFAGACAGCHSWTGKSPIWTQATLTGARAVNDPSAINVAQIVVEGAIHKTPTGTVFMPAFGNSLLRRRDRRRGELRDAALRLERFGDHGQGRPQFAPTGLE